MRRLAIGIGCTSTAPTEEVLALVTATLGTAPPSSTPTDPGSRGRTPRTPSWPG